MSDQPLTLEDLLKQKPYFDAGHQGDVDYPQILSLLRMTPTERLRHHEGWRHFVKEVAPRAKVLRRGRRKADTGTG
jgi:hypothetical protein